MEEEEFSEAREDMAHWRRATRRSSWTALTVRMKVENIKRKYSKLTLDVEVDCVE